MLTRRRVIAAVESIAGRGGPLASIAVRCGFSDQSHMTREFTRRVGDWIGRAISRLLLRFGRDPIDELGERAVDFRARIGDTMRRTWPNIIRPGAP